MPQEALMRTKSDINITPLIDVLLVLLVIFMVITPLTPQGLDAAIPRPAVSGEKQATPDGTLILRVDHEGQIHLNSELVEFSAVLPRLRDIFSTRADRTIFVQADDELLYNEVVKLIDVSKGAGATRVGLLTNSPSPAFISPVP